jgi:hypothetical protein
MLGLHFNPENGGSMFFGNVGKLAPGDNAPHFGRHYFIFTAVITSNLTTGTTDKQGNPAQC